MKKRAIIYIRVSTAKQAEEVFSIPQQKERLEKYCAAMDWEIANVYIDNGYTGGDMERPGLKSLINAVKTGSRNIVLVDKLDRLSRSQYDALYLIQKIFEPAGITFVSRAENFNTSTPMGKCSPGSMAVFAELECSRIREHMKDGKEGHAKAGKWHGGGTVPFGYRYINGELEIDEYEAAQVCMDYETIMTFVNTFEECRAKGDVRGINIALSEIIEQIIIDGNALKIKWKFD